MDVADVMDVTEQGASLHPNGENPRVAGPNTSGGMLGDSEFDFVTFAVQHSYPARCFACPFV